MASTHGIDLVIFDCDGVLVDSEPITARVIAEMACELGAAWEADGVHARFEGGKLSDVIAALEAETGRPAPKAFITDFRARLFERLDREVEVVPGITEVLRDLPYACCVASNGPRAKMQTTLSRAKLLSFFDDRIFSAYDMDAFKPAPDLFLHAATTLGAEPARCVVIEDSANGIRAAHAAGMPVLAFRPSGQGVGVEPTRMFGRMDELLGLLATLHQPDA